MELLPAFHPEGDEDKPLQRRCWKCQLVYPDNVAEDNEEARCPKCQASQAVCECGDPGAETCCECDQDICTGCWPDHKDPLGSGEAPCGGGIERDDREEDGEP